LPVVRSGSWVSLVGRAFISRETTFALDSVLWYGAYIEIGRKKMEGSTIGELARESGVGVETIRFYERRGLIEQPEKPPSGYRKYPAETAVRVRFIRNAKELGFSLREIRELLSLAGTSEVNRQGMRGSAEAKIAEIDTRVEGLLKLREELSGLVEVCRTGKRKCRCPIVEAFEHRGAGSVPSAAKRKE
jgi:MerR family mercuric resistance operon transcriptional regulator